MPDRSAPTASRFIDPGRQLPLQVAARWPPEEWLPGGVVLAVSGGADSMALLRLAEALAGEHRERVAVAHFDHRLRADSAEDAQFVAAACDAQNLACIVGRWNDPPAPDRGGWEAGARQARYRFLAETATGLDFRFVATAHTADDQAETILHRIIRGTGLRGLAGIHAARPLSTEVTLVRPLLGTRRNELAAYLDAIRQPCRVDPSNFDLRRTRNRLRHDLLPLVCAQFNPQAADALARLGNFAGEAQEALDDLGARLLACSVKGRSETSVILAVSGWANEPQLLIQVALQRLWAEQRWREQGMNARHWRLLVRLAQGVDRAALALPGPISARSRRGELTLQVANRESERAVEP